ncbi:MAG: oligosaccharide flippase family protein [Deltaproteobacteria bacterium]|nr:oligosaccharide flippase family protein [Deltaproteobacteria bacterium]
MSSAPSLGTKVNRGVAWATAGQAVIGVADLISQILIVALWIPAGDLGLAGGAMAFYTALDYIADLGVSSALIQHDDHTPERVSTMFWLNLLITGGLFVALLGFGPLYGWLEHQPVLGWLLIGYGGKLVLQNLYAIPFALLKKEMRYSEIAVARIIAHSCESIARIVFAALGFTVWCWTLAALVRALVFGVIIQIRHPFVPKAVFRLREATHYVRFGLRTAASNVLYYLYTSMDVPVILLFFDKTAAGIYTLADQIVLEPVKSIANIVTDVAYPAFAKARNDRPALHAELIKLTRFNLMTILPYVTVVLLVIPEILHIFYSRGHWTPRQLDLAGDAARLLCVMGLFRALGYLGPPVLDGTGHPERTLRYMVIATFAVPGSFFLGAALFGPIFTSPDARFLSVALAWAIGYPIAFAALAFLVVRTIDLPLGRYLGASVPIAVCAGVGIAAGFAVDLLVLPNASAPLRLVAIAGTALATIGLLLAFWQGITPRSIVRSLK